MVRAACCEKKSVKKGPWSAEEDQILISFIYSHGHGNWRALPKLAGLKRCGKSCRLRWVNYLRPDIKRGNFTKEEEDTIIDLHRAFGNKWSAIAARLPGRTDNEIKNVWHTHIKKKLVAENAAPASFKQTWSKTTKKTSMDSAAVGTENTASSNTSTNTTQLSHTSDSVSTPGSPSVASGDQIIIVNSGNSIDEDEGARERSFGSLETLFPEIDEAGRFRWLEDDDDAVLTMDFTALEFPSSPFMVEQFDQQSSSHLADDRDFWLQLFMVSTGNDQLMEQPHTINQSDA